MTSSRTLKKKQQPAALKTATRDLVCFSHLRWDFVYQRPQHLMNRAAKDWRVFFVEEPVMKPGKTFLEVRPTETGVTVVVPHFPPSDARQELADHKQLVDQLFQEQGIQNPALWYYTPMALPFTRHLDSDLIVYDCMDDLASFRGAPKKMREMEAEMLRCAHLVFTGGQSLFEAKKDQHDDIYAFPSSIDREHFGRARHLRKTPDDQKDIPHPRLGYFGVIDERIDLELIDSIAQARPDWSLVMIGPVAKINKETLPKHPNIHYLGQKDYEELPNYLAGWDVALMPFAINEATRFISPTKTPEYLAGGRPVVSTAIQDVVRPYGEQGLVWIASTVSQFINAIESALELNGTQPSWLERVDRFLTRMSWDSTWNAMNKLMQTKLALEVDEDDDAVDVSLPDPAGEESIAMLPMPVSRPVMNRGRSTGYDYLVVGAGFAGSVLAERLARGSGKKVLIIDRRNHIAGNAYDHYDDAGILIHKYGPHIFHTNSREVFAYLSRFTEWRPYEHRVRASVDGQLLPIPINLDTINKMYGLQLDSFELEKFFESMAENVKDVRTSEDVVVSKIGRELYEKFFRNYTRKQWDLDPSELDATVTSRVPIRLNRDDRYFTDTFQAMPLRGYTAMFENLLDHPNIHIMLNADYRDVFNYVPFKEIVFTGPVDEFFDYRFGKLPYRSLQFEFKTLEQEQAQDVAVYNYPNEHAYTRSTEFKHLTGQVHSKTSLVYEYPCSEGDPYYPIPRQENSDLYKRYKQLADETKGVHFCGRLATYRYYNMDQVTAQALTVYSRMSGVRRAEVSQEFAQQVFPVDLPCNLLVGGEQD
jgi:UDP-galactopyranose mutase